MNDRTKIGLIGETAVTLELLKKGFDVININCTYKNYKNADLLCMNANNGKSVMIQVKTGTSKNILTGFVSELDGTIEHIEKKIIGPWVFVSINPKNLSDINFYVLTKEEVLNLITSSNKWYVTEWNRKLKCKPIVGIDISWLEGKNVEKTDSHFKLKHNEFINPLGHNSINRWDKIVNLLNYE